jgi:integrase/recombinase XerD
LRVSEVVRLRVSDMDSARMMLRVQGGKGARDRYTLLWQRLLIELPHGAASASPGHGVRLT